MPDTDIIKRSVTAGDYAETPQGGAFFMAVRNWGSNTVFPPSLEGMGPRESDYITASSVDREAIWAGAVAIAITKVSSLSWEIDGDIPLRNKRAHELMLNADAGRGWVSFLSKILQDFLLTNNGAFIELVRETQNENSPIIGMIPLDSLRSTRTGNPETPVAYMDLQGKTHELKYYEVLEFADMPSSRASMFGSGKCAAYRTYKPIYKLANIEQYISDKVSGRRPLAVHLINGLNAAQLQSVLDTAQSVADAKGVISYMGAIMATIPGETQPGVATIPLADFPDNFNRKDELDITILAYANNLGLDPQDLQPLTGQALGTGAQSQVLNEKAKGKGLAAFRQQLTHALNMWVLPDRCTFGFVEKDWRDKIAKADYNTKTGTYINESVTNGVITAGQGLQVMVDENIYPKEFLTVDQTPDDTLSDDEKPGAEVDVTAPVVPVVSKGGPGSGRYPAGSGNGGGGMGGITGDKREYSMMGAGGIEPRNSVDPDKVDLLVSRMKQDGWQGNPILVYDAGDSTQAITGSHRIVAAQQAGISIPVNMIDVGKFSEQEAEDFLNASDDDEVLSVFKKMNKNGSISKEQLRIMREEAGNSAWVIAASRRKSVKKYYTDHPIPQVMAKEARAAVELVKQIQKELENHG